MPTTDTRFAPVLEAVNDLNPYHLAAEAECSTPDSLTSAGARMLTSVQDAFAEALESALDDDPDLDVIDWANDEAHEIADNAPDVYTATRWAEFVDLGAYNEDPTDLGFDGSDMEAGAGICLYIIAERLVHRLAETAAEALASLDEDDDDGR